MTTIDTMELQRAADAALDAAIAAGVPGVSAGVTNRDGTRYEGAAGVRALGTDAAFTTDTVCAIYSTTKAITGTAVLQLVERGELDLDTPAKHYVPELGEIQVLDGFAADGSPQLRAPRRDITTRMLLTHTAGFGYDFFNAKYRRLAEQHHQPGVVTGRKAALTTPLLFDPGDGWEYGSSIDWAGQVVERITGRRLGEVLGERVFAPLGMADTAFALTPDLRARRATIHQRRPDGTLRTTGFELPAEPEVQMGGHGLYSTTLDYLKFIRMWLDDGAAPDGSRVLRPDTVAMASANQLPSGTQVTMLPGIVPSLSHDMEFFPGLPKSWAFTHLVNDADAPTGRRAGSLGWAGLANAYYWIDRRTGIGGFWTAQLFPFADPAALRGYLDFETAVYRALD